MYFYLPISSCYLFANIDDISGWNSKIKPTLTVINKYQSRLCVKLLFLAPPPQFWRSIRSEFRNLISVVFFFARISFLFVRLANLHRTLVIYVFNGFLSWRHRRRMICSVRRLRKMRMDRQRGYVCRSRSRSTMFHFAVGISSFDFVAKGRSPCGSWPFLDNNSIDDKADITVTKIWVNIELFIYIPKSSSCVCLACLSRPMSVLRLALRGGR